MENVEYVGSHLKPSNLLSAVSTADKREAYFIVTGQKALPCDR